MRKLRKISAGVIASTLLLNGNAYAATTADLEQRIQELEQTVRLLSRKQEVAEEVYTADKAKTAAPGVGTVKAGPDGFALTAADKSAELKIRGLMQFDGRFFDDKDDKFDDKDTFLLRRVRPTFDGRIGDISWRITPEFANDDADLVDGYVDWNLPVQEYTGANPLVFRAGQFKGPVGLERLQSGSALVFLERAFPTELVPNRDRGLELYSNLFDKRLSVELAATNGTADGRDATNSDFDGEPEFNGRLFFEPVPGIGFGVAGTHGEKLSKNDSRSASTSNNQAFLPRYRSPGQQTIFQYKTDVADPKNPTGPNISAIADGDHTRLVPQAYAYVGPFGVMAEYAESEQAVGFAGSTEDFTNKAAQVTAVWAITGEPENYKGFIKPVNSYGAWELALRWSTLENDNSAFELGFADPSKSVENADELGIGVNWVVTQNLKILADYTHTEFDGGAAKGGDRPDEDLFSTRLQLNY